MIDAVTIRRATLDDAAAVATLAAKTFVDTFAADNRPEDMAVHLATAYGVTQQSAEIVDPDYVTLLAFVGGTLAAFAQVRRKTPPPCVTGDDPIEIHRFYVDQRWHGQGIAQHLMQWVLTQPWYCHNAEYCSTPDHRANAASFVQTD